MSLIQLVILGLHNNLAMHVKSYSLIKKADAVCHLQPTLFTLLLKFIVILA